METQGSVCSAPVFGRAAPLPLALRPLPPTCWKSCRMSRCRARVWLRESALPLSVLRAAAGWGWGGVSGGVGVEGEGTPTARHCCRQAGGRITQSLHRLRLCLTPQHRPLFLPVTSALPVHAVIHAAQHTQPSTAPLSFSPNPVLGAPAHAVVDVAQPRQQLLYLPSLGRQHLQGEAGVGATGCQLGLLGL